MTYCYRLEKRTPVEADLTKYPELRPFLAGRNGFRGISFDVDTNEYAFAFPTAKPTASAFFSAVETEAFDSGWHLAAQEPTRQLYRRGRKGSAGIEQVSLSYDTKAREVTLVWKAE